MADQQEERREQLGAGFGSTRSSNCAPGIRCADWRCSARRSTPDFDPERSDLDFLVDFEARSRRPNMRTPTSVCSPTSRLLFGRPVGRLVESASPP